MATSGVLVAGGTSGLGLKMALRFAQHCEVHVCGRHDPKEPILIFHKVDFAREAFVQLALTCESLLASLPRIDTFVYAAGFYQEGTIDSLSDQKIASMLSVGLGAPAALLQQLIFKQGSLHEFIAITSTSEYTPRPMEPVYAAVKAGLGHLANSVADGEKVTKTMVVAPGGMNTPFWKGADRGVLLEPDLVAERIMQLRLQDYVYMHVKLPRPPAEMSIGDLR